MAKKDQGLATLCENHSLTTKAQSDRVVEEFRRHLAGWSIARGSPTDQTSLLPAGLPLWTDSTGSLRLFCASDSREFYFLAFLDTIAVEIDIVGKSLKERISQDVPYSTRDHFLLDQVLPRMLSRGEKLVLHAGAVHAGESAIAFLGASGAGKSTLSASFDQAGFPIIGDDAIMVSPDRPSCSVECVYPSLRLFSDSREMLLPGLATEEVAHYSNKELIELERQGDKASRPLQALFVLSSSSDRTHIRRLSAAETCMALINNSFALDPTDLTEATKLLKKASKIAEHVPAFQIEYPRSYEKLSRVREAILDTLALP